MNEVRAQAIDKQSEMWKGVQLSFLTKNGEKLNEKISI